MRSLQALVDRLVLWALGGAAFHAIALDHRPWAGWFILLSGLIVTTQVLEEVERG